MNRRCLPLCGRRSLTEKRDGKQVKTNGEGKTSTNLNMWLHESWCIFPIGKCREFILLLLHTLWNTQTSKETWHTAYHETAAYCWLCNQVISKLNSRISYKSQHVAQQVKLPLAAQSASLSPGYPVFIPSTLVFHTMAFIPFSVHLRWLKDLVTPAARIGDRDLGNVFWFWSGSHLAATSIWEMNGWKWPSLFFVSLFPSSVSFLPSSFLSLFLHPPFLFFLCQSAFHIVNK